MLKEKLIPKPIQEALKQNSNTLKYYRFRQNNSGGHFVGPTNVFIQANSAVEANGLAIAKAGIYFNGVDKGEDCSCCGDRWYEVYEDKYDTGVVPTAYGAPFDTSAEKSYAIYNYDGIAIVCDE